MKNLSHCVCSGFLVSLTSSAPKTTQPLEQGQTQKFLLFPQTEAEATAWSLTEIRFSYSFLEYINQRNVYTIGRLTEYRHIAGRIATARLMIGPDVDLGVTPLAPVAISFHLYWMQPSAILVFCAASQFICTWTEVLSLSVPVQAAKEGTAHLAVTCLYFSIKSSRIKAISPARSNFGL